MQGPTYRSLGLMCVSVFTAAALATDTHHHGVIQTETQIDTHLRLELDGGEKITVPVIYQMLPADQVWQKNTL